MGVYLKGAFYTVNVLLELVAVLIITFSCVMGYMTGSDSDGATIAIHLHLWLRAAGFVVVSMFGIYGAIKEKTWPLVTYITACVIGVLIFLTQGIPFAVAKAKMPPPVSYDMQSMTGVLMMVMDVMLAMNFVPALLGIIGVILAALLIRQLHRRDDDALNRPQEMQYPLDEMQNPPDYSELSPMAQK